MNEETGAGGSYLINESGERVLVERTLEHSLYILPDIPLESLPDIQPIDEPATAGFFTPAAPTTATPIPSEGETHTSQE